MRQKSRFRNHFLSSLWLVMVLLISLFWAIGATFQPLPAAAQTLPPANQISNFRAPLNTLTSPSSWLIQATSVATLYLPIIYRNPQPAFWDDFSDDDSGWPVGTDSACSSKYEGGRYQLNVDNDEECFRFAPPDEAERVYGSFEVSVYHSDYESSDAFFGLYFNGKGGNEQYIFRIRPNVPTSTCSSGGQWELRRRWVDDDENQDDLIRRACESTLKRGYGSANINTIRAKHTNTGQLVLYINNKIVFDQNESSISGPELTGKGTGVYVSAPESKSIIVKFDDFKVYTLANSP